MLADELDYVLGVDTHRDEHVLAVVTAPAGAIVAGRAAPTNAHGYRALLRVADHHAPGRRAWAIEGTGSYGAGLRRYLHARGESVLEVSRSRAVSADSVAKTTGWTRPGRHAQRLPARRLRCHEQGSGAKRSVCCSSRAEAPSTSAAKRSANSARSSSPPQNRSASSCAACRPVRCSTAAVASDGRPRAPTSSPPGSSCAASRDHPGRNPRSRRARAGDPRPRLRARTDAARRARHRTDRRRATDRRLVTPRPASFRSVLCAPRRRRTRPRLKRQNATAPT